MALSRAIFCTIAGTTVELRPSLRNAMTLERREGSFATLIRAVMDGNLTAAVDIVRPNYNPPFLESKILDTGLDNLKGPMLLYIAACAGIDEELDEDDDAPKKKGGKPISFEEHLLSLYRIGTGWLGWTPQVALDATPAEIREAYKGRVDMLRAIFGGSQEDDEDATPLADKFKEAFRSFEGHTIVKREDVPQ